MSVEWIDVPGHEGTVANAVARDGTVVGVVKAASGRIRSFVLRPGGEPATLVTWEGRDTFFQDVTDGGLVLGDALGAAGSGMFLWHLGEFQRIEPPQAAEAWAGGLRGNGDVCGCIRDERDRRVGVRRLSGRWTNVLPAGAESSVLYGMGDDGEVVGACALGGQRTGFVARPDDETEWLEPPQGDFLPADCARGGSWIVGAWSVDGVGRAAERKDGSWRVIDLGAETVESAAVGACAGVGVVGWALFRDGVKRGFLRRE